MASSNMRRNDNNKRIDYIEIPVSDMAVAKRFYRRVFGWRYTDYGKDYASFFDGRLGGGLCKASCGGMGGTLVIFYSTQLEALQEKIAAEGGVIVKEIFSFPGGRRFHFQDPCGNELAVWSDL